MCRIDLRPALLMAALATATVAQDPLPGPDAPQPAEAFGADHPADALPPKPAPPPLSVELGISVDDVPRFDLGPVDLDQIAAEDEERRASGSKVLRYGVGRDVSFTLLDGVWVDVDDNGHLWSLDVRAEGALGLRLHFADVDLPEGSQIAVYSTSGPNPRVWSFFGRGWHGDGEFWTPTVFGDTVRIEYYHSKHNPDVNRMEGFHIDRVQHIYHDPLALGGPRGAAGCLDVTCLGATWNDMARASAGIGTVNSDSLFCSGTMLNATNTDLTPYWLTANHCLSTNGQANSSEIYWLFHTATCNGAAPSISTVPQSAPCTLLATGTTSDFTLLMVEGTVPRTQVRWAGWASAAVANGTGCTCIHHPRGSHKRYSQGSKQSVLTCSASGHVNIDWTTRGTEPGSSGSGVFRNDNQQLFGQLHCGASNCEGANSDDDYGAFVTSFPNISTLLAGGSDDALEQNDSCASPRVLSPGTNNNLIVKSTDEDWYRVNVPAGNQITVTLTFTHANGDVDTDLEGACGTVLDASHGVGNTETLQWTNTGAAADVHIQVYLFSDTRNSYNMTIAVGCPPGSAPANNACASAQNLVIGGAFGGNISCATNDGASSCGTTTGNRDVWWSYTPFCNGMLTVNTCGTHDNLGVDSGMDTVLSIHTGCPGTAANQVAGGCNDDGAGDPCGAEDNGLIRDSYLTVPVIAGQNYRIRVTHFSTVIGDGAYSLTSSFVPDALPAPTGVSATDGTSCTLVTISWNPVAGTTGYSIWRNTVNNSVTAVALGTDTASPFNDTTAVPGTTYFYWVRATGGACPGSGFSAPDTGFRCVANPCPADLNNSGDIDLGDLAILLSNFGSVGPGIPGDIDNDGAVDLDDLSALLSVFGTNCP